MNQRHLIDRKRPQPGQHDRFEHIVSTLGLNDTQQAAFKQFQAAQRHGGPMHKSNTTIWAKVADPATPADQIAGLLEGTVKNRTEYQQGIANALGKFLATLTPEQRAKFIAEARQPTRRHGPWSRLRHLQ